MMDNLIVSSLLFRLNLVTECHDLSCSIQSFYILTQLGRFLQIKSISFVWRLYSNSPFLVPDNYLYSSVLPFTSAWEVVKDTPNHILENMIGSAQTSREIIEDGDVPIFSVVLITPTRKVYPKSTFRF